MHRSFDFDLNMESHTALLLYTQAPILTDLYTSLVTDGAFANAEQRLLDALNGGVLSEYLSKFK
jgi:hypothetical protein